MIKLVKEFDVKISQNLLEVYKRDKPGGKKKTIWWLFDDKWWLWWMDFEKCKYGNPLKNVIVWVFNQLCLFICNTLSLKPSKMNAKPLLSIIWFSINNIWWKTIKLNFLNQTIIVSVHKIMTLTLKSESCELIQF